MKQIMEIKLGALHVRGPENNTKRMTLDLLAVARGLNRARNAMVRYFLDYHAAHPGDECLPRKHTPAECLPRKHTPAGVERELSATTALYHAGRKTAPEINSNLVSAAAQEVWAKLRAKVSYTYRVQSRYVWQGVLAHELAPPQYTERRSDTNTGLAIPAPRSQTSFAYCGQVAGIVEKPRLQAESESTALLRFILWSKDSGRKQKSYTARVEVRQLSEGNRAFLRKIARGEIRMADSRLVFKRGEWYFQMTYEPESGKATGELRGLLIACPHVALRPFQLEIAKVRGESPAATEEAQAEEGARPFTVRLPSVEPLLEKMRRLTARRRAMQYRQRHNAPGHGRERIYAMMRPLDRERADQAITWIRHTASLLAKRAWEADCSVIEYWEPTVRIREYLWFGKRGIPFNWTTWLQQLTGACAKRGVAIDQKIATSEWYRERFDENVFKGSPRTSEIVLWPGVKDLEASWPADEEARSVESIEKLRLKRKPDGTYDDGGEAAK